MLKDGGSGITKGLGNLLPARWGVKEGQDEYAVYCGPSVGPTLAEGMTCT